VVNSTYVLDASAVLDFLGNGPGAKRVAKLFMDAERLGIPLLMSMVNWGEVFYYSWQHHGQEVAQRTLANFEQLPLQLIDVDLSQVLKAGEFKVLHKIPYVDSLAAALATLRRATLVTADRDFEKLGRSFSVLWLPRR